jgi:beta-mannosidase
MHRVRHELTDNWTLSLATENTAHSAPTLPGEVRATVPGCVHTDLLAAGLIPDPYLDENELALGWIGHQEWRYRTTVHWSPTDRARTDLVCDGLDTVATIALNGVEVGRTFNQHRSYRFDVSHVLRPGANEFEISFASAWEHAESVEAELGPLPNAYPAPFNFIRKMACNFGWDWGPTLVTAGIWRPIALETWTTARIAEVRPTLMVNGSAGRVELAVDLEKAATVELTVGASIGGTHVEATLAADSDSTLLVLDVPDVDLWWTHDLGSQPLYDLTIELSDGEESLDGWQSRVGFRTIVLDTAADEIGSAFTLVVNGVPIFARGANWIPDDCFPSRIGRERLRTRVTQATGANLNLLRVWGGGLYESDDFYSLCDELGVLVWQDFLFACAAYPEEEPVRAEVIAEARENVARLMPHPSLAMWNGCNENIWGWFDWSWREHVGSRSWGSGYYFDLLPSVVAEIDPQRPYYPGSPYSGSMDRHPNDDRHGPRHVWDVWNDIDYSNYRRYVPRFVAEFGYQGPPNWATLRRSINDRPLTPESPGMLSHQKATDGSGKLTRGAAAHLPVAEIFDDWHHLMQLNQAEALRYGIEHLRSHRGVCMGAVVWQLNDCWPVTSWAAVDGDGRQKLLWFALRAAMAPRLLTIQPRGDGLAVIAVNDSGVSWRGPLTMQRMRFDATLLASWETRLVSERLSATTVMIPAEVVTPAVPAGELLVAIAPGGERALWFFAEDKDLHLADPQLDVRVRPRPGGVDITVAAQSLARHVTLLADRLDPDAVVDDALVTLVPGESHTFRVDTGRSVDATALSESGALRHLNRLLTGAAG